MNWEVLTMRSATSYFKTLLRSDLRHYWPVGFVYAAIWIIGLPVTIWNRCMGWDDKAQQLNQVISTTFEAQFMGVIMAAIFGVLMAMAVFSYLMTARSAGLHHSLPAKRSTQYAAHFSAAMAMLLGGNVLTFVLALLVEGVMGAVGLKALLWWLLVVSLVDFIFLSLGVFCAMLTGWVLAVPVIYAGINFVVPLVELLLGSMAGNFYFGYVSRDLSAFSQWMSPLIKLGNELNDNGLWLPESGSMTMNRDGLRSVVIYTAAALVLLGVSFVLYRLRHSESAADLVAFSWAKPIFRCVIALVGGLSLGQGLCDLLLYNGGTSVVLLIVCVLATLTLCYVAAEMLIRKSFRVLRRSWKGLAVLSLLMVAVCVGMKLDVFGYESYVPQADQVKAISVYVAGDDQVDVENCTDPEAIAAAIATHSAVLERAAEPGGRDEAIGSNQVDCIAELTYAMAKGRDVTRHYYVNMERGSALHKAVNALAQTDAVRRNALLGNEVLKLEEISGGFVSYYPQTYYADEVTEYVSGGYQESLTQEQAQTLYRAILQDAERHHGQRDLMDDSHGCNFQLQFYVTRDGNTQEIYMDHFTPDCTETIAVLLELGVTNKAENLFGVH